MLSEVKGRLNRVLRDLRVRSASDGWRGPGQGRMLDRLREPKAPMKLDLSADSSTLAETVLAFSPQTVLDPVMLGAIGDHRWDVWISEMVAAGALDGKWSDLRSALPGARHGEIRYEVYFGDQDPLDRLHAERLGDVAGTRLYRMAEAHHHVVRKMRDSGALEKVLRRALDGRSGSSRSDQPRPAVRAGDDGASAASPH